MNIAVTSKEALLQAAKEIVLKEGLDQLNIRRIALTCGISIGAVYNYFPSKADLIFALIEDFWGHVASDKLCPPSMKMSFADYFEQLYHHLFMKLKDFKSGFLQQIMQFNHKEKEKGRAIEEIYWKHLKNGLQNALEKDNQILPSIWSESFSKDTFLEFIFTSMMVSLRNGQNDSIFLKEMITRLLYR